jgi:hypothetical protein
MTTTYLHRRGFCFKKYMNYLPIFFSLLLFTSCADSNQKIAIRPDTTAKKDTAAREDFTANFDTINRDSILVYPRMSSNAADDPTYPFSGRLLKNFDYSKVDTSKFEHPVKRKMNFFAAYSLPMGKHHTGLLLRTPSIYWESAIYLLLWNNEQKKVVDQLQVAEWWGDAGDLVFIQSYLLELKAKQPKILVVKNITRPVRITKSSFTITTDSVYRYIILDNHFKLEESAETDRDYLRRKYNIILRNVAG